MENHSSRFSQPGFDFLSTSDGPAVPELQRDVALRGALLSVEVLRTLIETARCSRDGI
jgi:hypothetical protein